MNKKYSSTSSKSTYDKEWVNLIIQAKKSGLSINEVREFLEHAVEKEKSTNY